jgi:tetratricopeptide (TPR) repeat protein
MNTSETGTPDSSSLPFTERFSLAGPDISEALEHGYQGEYADAILSWDKVLATVPDWAEGYYNRGNAYLKLLGNQRSQEEYIHYLSLAGADFDKAVELEPYSDGNYYYGRYQYYIALSGNEVTRVDSDYLEQIALDNLLMANQLGNYQEDAETKLAYLYSAVGKCDEAIEQANQLVAGTEEQEIDAVGALSMGYLCKNDLPNALKYMDEVVRRIDNCRSRYEHARILYIMGRPEDALVDLDSSIAKDPYYCGMRYFLRGLIYAEKGNLEKAQDDLYFGMGQTWEQGGLLSYAQGKIVLAQGDKESAIQYFQEAEATYEIHDAILTKMQQDLAALGALPLEQTPSVSFATAMPTLTPAPTLTPSITPRPTSSPNSAMPTPIFTADFMLQSITIVDLEKTIGPIEIKKGSNFDWRWQFQAAQSLDHREVKKLSIWLNSSDTSQGLPRQLYLWNFRNNMWGGVEELKWGENPVDYPNEYVSPDGDVIVYVFSHDGVLNTTIDSLGVTLIVQRTDGSIELHGVTP